MLSMVHCHHDSNVTIIPTKPHWINNTTRPQVLPEVYPWLGEREGRIILPLTETEKVISETFVAMGNQYP